MTDLQKIQDQLEKAMSELKEIDNEETQLAYDYIEYANILVKNLILYGVVVNEANWCDDCQKPIRMTNNTLQLLCECEISEAELVCNRINDNNSNRCITCGVKAGHTCGLQTN